MNFKKSMVMFTILVVVSSIVLMPMPVKGQQRGPVIDRLRLRVVTSPDAQVLAMMVREIDVLTDMIRPSDVAYLDGEGKKVTSASGFHLCNFMFNMRPTLYSGETNPLNDVNFRHALFHLIPKAQIIGSMFSFIVGQLDTMVPPSMSEWFKSNVDPHPFSDPAVLGADCEAVKILVAAGYQPQGSWPYTSWLDPDGNVMPDLRVFVPIETTAPTSYQVGLQWVLKVQAIGLTNFQLTPMEFSESLILMYDQWDFEVGWSCYTLGRYPDYLYGMLHSSENYPGSSNPHGIYWQALDAELYTLKFGLDYTAKVAACKKAQELLMGGTATNPLPYPYSRTGYYNWSLARLPVYSRKYYDAQQPELTGAESLAGSGIDNMWTPMRTYWSVDPSTIGRVDPDGKTFTVWCVGNYPETLNPLGAKTSYTWDFMSPIYDSLIIPNLYASWYEPWLATDWEIVYSTETPLPPSVEMAVKFWLRNDVNWQDGTSFTIDDVKFAWEFLRDWQIPKTWSWAQHITDVVTDPIDNSVTCYLDTTSQWIILELSGWGAALPLTVWAQNPITGNPWADVTEILNFDPAQTWVGGPLPTYLYGTGPFIFKFYNPYASYGDLDANRNYWLTQTEIEQKIPEQLHAAGNVVDQPLPLMIDIYDLSAIGASYGQPESLCVSGFNNDKTGWTRVGNSPYLSAAGDGNYIYESTESSTIGDFDFQDKAAYKPEPFNVILQLSCRQDFCNKSDIDVYILDGTDWYLVGTIYPRATWRWISIDVTDILNTKAKVNAAKMYLHKSGSGPGYQNVYVDCARLQYLDQQTPQPTLEADIRGAMGTPPDGKIDIDDLIICGMDYGKPWWVPAIYGKDYREIPEITAW